MASAKTVRLRNITSGVVVETTEENAERLAVGDFEPATTKRTSRKSEGDGEK